MCHPWLSCDSRLCTADHLTHDLLVSVQVWDKCDDAPNGPETPDPGALSSWQDIEAALAETWNDDDDSDSEDDNAVEDD